MSIDAETADGDQAYARFSDQRSPGSGRRPHSVHVGCDGFGVRHRGPIMAQTPEKRSMEGSGLKIRVLRTPGGGARIGQSLSRRGR
jgi:hypothetical protein